MAMTLSHPTIPGFSGEVEQFAAAHEMTEALQAIYEATTRLFSAARGVRVELYTDHEDDDWVSVFFVIEGWPLSWEATKPLDREWYRVLASLIPPGVVWSIGHTIEWLE